MSLSEARAALLHRHTRLTGLRCILTVMHLALLTGVATETFALSDADGGRTLTVDTTMRFKARPGGVAYRTVYRRT